MGSVTSKKWMDNSGITAYKLKFILILVEHAQSVWSRLQAVQYISLGQSSAGRLRRERSRWATRIRDIANNTWLTNVRILTRNGLQVEIAEACCIFLVCNHVTRRPCWWSIQKKFFGKICIKIEIISQRRETLLFLTPNMVAVTSPANQQYLEKHWSRKWT